MYKNKLMTRTNKINEWIKTQNSPSPMKLLPVVTSAFEPLLTNHENEIQAIQNHPPRSNFEAN